MWLPGTETIPYKYDLNLFNTIASVSYDHPDPSIYYTVLTSPSGKAGYANIDFVIFPPRWMVARRYVQTTILSSQSDERVYGLLWENTMLSRGRAGYSRGASLHNCMSAHGPDAEAWDKATHRELKPHKIDQTMAFMFESLMVYDVADHALASPHLQRDYLDAGRHCLSFSVAKSKGAGGYQ